MDGKTRWLTGMSVGAVALVVGTALCPCGSEAAPKKQVEPAASKAIPLVGAWKGALKAGDKQLRLVFHLVEKSGRVIGTLDSPDQNARGIPVETLWVKDGLVNIPVKTISGRFVGRRSSDAMLEGKWRQSGAAIPLTLTRTAP